MNIFLSYQCEQWNFNWSLKIQPCTLHWMRTQNFDQEKSYIPDSIIGTYNNHILIKLIPIYFHYHPQLLWNSREINHIIIYYTSEWNEPNCRKKVNTRHYSFLPQIDFVILFIAHFICGGFGHQKKGLFRLTFLTDMKLLWVSFLSLFDSPGDRIFFHFNIQ